MERGQQLMNGIHKWADEAFGKERTCLAPLYHLKEEVNELIDAIEELQISDNKVKSMDNVLKEFADCYILLNNAASKYGLSYGDLLSVAEAKMVINKSRKWEQKGDENGVHHHIKDILPE